jgi:hypothetical protein
MSTSRPIPQIVIDTASNMINHPNQNVRDASESIIEETRRFCEEVIQNKKELRKKLQQR